MGRFIFLSSGLLVVFLSLSGADFECPTEWCPYDQHCYRAFDEPKRSVDAEKFCVEQAGHLASIESKEEADFVAQLVSENVKSSPDYVWIGLWNQRKEQYCNKKWTDGSSVIYQIMVERFRKNCFGLEKESGYRTWLNLRCGDDYPFVCKFPPRC
uniref:C-type lectin-like protein n=1 Tax=Bitis arietans TaxID=8692 RepID=A0A1B3AXS3_BITAR|nr:C-type lectin-like protein [Bitis arietans]